MRKRTTILALVACTLCVVLALVQLAREPRSKGVSLTKWLTIYRGSAQRFSFDPHPELADWESPEAEAAADAVRAIQSQALPLLEKWMSYRPAAWKTWLYDYTGVLPDFLQKSAPVQWLNPDHGTERLELALAGFAILRSDAARAIPALTEIAADPSAPGTLYALRSLYEIGPPAVPALTNLLATARPEAQEEIRLVLARMGPGAQDAIPTLIHDLASSDRVLAFQSAGMLGRIGQKPELVVPALMRALDDPREDVRQSAAFALRMYGDAARPAVPKLQALLGDTHLVQAQAREALQTIAPEALTNAPPAQR
ncbi:MAG TPA: HEAT repeat domain-containing protein [Verrucomicrobiota bacterium]|nr:HEAT repeat domain-containing protein [Verrucomicrobiota bacterium]